ncbi:2-hydroxy-3-keto-5-methylthiopentenyl-1-phosphate phosphatase [Aquisphaera giovannonii]|uniref:phosphoserine phosphatase n=1 Tax=Aquisphaera giovannonii TaxID=406548 RepID=A0A5B9WD89_9BACT|nr:HAD-IB family phosphatase [Aquisphaera giovannonii]QEH38576.1 2-hydroxy-3-keto-5-methylthiopentenyl-1-phosphate phosphatase [Aquisphaera giovannonii]
MPDSHPHAPARKLLVSDFDGTMTREDFYQLVRRSLLPPGVPDYWGEYRAGRMTHFQALQAYFATIREDEATVRKVVEEMGLDPKLKEDVAALREAGWDVAVTSAGCDWYIRILLAEAGVELTVWSNPGRFVAGEGLLMDPPTESPFYSASTGVDKAGVVRDAIGRGLTVAFAGDGFPDADAARLVPGGLRFARADLAAVLRDEGLPFRPFERWSEIAAALAGR